MPAPTRRAANPSAHPPQPTPANPSLPLWQLLAHCADAVQAVRAGRSLTDALEACPAPARPGTQALSFAVMRRLGLASRLRALLVPRAPAPWVDSLLCSALALACGTEYPAHTLVDQAVDAAKRKARPASGMVNAVLRRFLREQASLVSQAQQDPTARWNHPAWWIKTLQHDWPDHWPALLEANQHAAPMMLRVNPGGHGASQTPAASPEAVPEVLDAPGASSPSTPAQTQTTRAARAARAAYQQALEAMGVRSQAFGDAGLLLDQARPVQQLPGFAQGWVSVQDASAQRAAPLLINAGLQPGARVLDACSAPGGKTAHLLETLDVQLLALDVDAQRMQRVDETLARLHLSARTQVADAAQPSTWWDGQCFDAIVLDAPCSASGIVRRHPDVRWLRRASDIQALADTQDRLLDALWPLLAPDGLLLYCTCSVFRQEGQDRIDAFLQRQPLALPLPAPGHLLPVVEYPTGPLDTPGPAVAANTLGDGFFYALLRKPGPAL